VFLDQTRPTLPPNENHRAMILNLCESLLAYEKERTSDSQAPESASLCDSRRAGAPPGCAQHQNSEPLRWSAHHRLAKRQGCGKASVNTGLPNITEDVRKYAAELGIAEEDALKRGMEEKSKEIVEKGVFEDRHASTQAYLKAMIFVRE
jgi:hypothetical protein